MSLNTPEVGCKSLYTDNSNERFFLIRPSAGRLRTVYDYPKLENLALFYWVSGAVPVYIFDYG